jgi:signal transduction histidine kinase
LHAELKSHGKRCPSTDQTQAKDFDLVEIEAALRIYLQRPTKRITITKEFPEKAMLCGLAEEILQVVSNLLLNTLHALPAQDANIRLRIRLIGDRLMSPSRITATASRDRA